MKNTESTRKLTGIAILTAIVAVLQLLANYIQFTVSINLSLIPIVIGAILYGPLAGLFLGIVNGVIVLTAPSTLVFFNINPFYTILTCLLKTGLAGLISGLLFNLFKNENKKLGVFVSSVSAPIVNTSIFALFCLLFFKDFLNSLTTEANPDIYSTLFLVVIGANFIIEFLVNSFLSSAIYVIIDVVKKRK